MNQIILPPTIQFTWFVIDGFMEENGSQKNLKSSFIQSFLKSHLKKKSPPPPPAPTSPRDGGVGSANYAYAGVVFQ